MLRFRNGNVYVFQYFENVTVMFSYLDGFVTICSQVSAMEIVSLVNTMFTTLDKLTEKHDVYKVTQAQAKR